MRIYKKYFLGDKKNYLLAYEIQDMITNLTHWVWLVRFTLTRQVQTFKNIK